MQRPTVDSAASEFARSSIFWIQKLPFFYGWIVLAIAVIAMVATTPGQTHGVTIFNPFFTEAIGLSKSQLSGAYMVATLLAGLTMPWLGAWMDKRGIRLMMSLVVCGLSATCLLASFVSGLPSLLLVFFLLRMLGQGALSLLASNAVGMWFDSRLGTANGILNVVATLLTSQVLLGMSQLTVHFGWRATYRILALCIAIVMLPLLAILFRNRPSEIGEQTDGRAAVFVPRPDRSPRGLAPQQMRDSFDFASVLRTRSYWILVLARTAWSLIGTALIFHIHSMFDARRLPTTDASQTLTHLFIAAAAMQLISGILADRIPLNWLLAASAGGMLLAIWMMLSEHASLLGPGYLTFGVSQAVTGVVSGTVWIRYFGRAHIGKIRGSVFSALVAGSALGPYAMAFLYERYGSYRPALGLFAAIYLVVGLLTLMATPPQRKQQATA